jgi:hypothetical protein
VLTERVDDQRIAGWATTITNDIIEEYEKYQTMNPLFVRRYNLMVEIVNDTDPFYGRFIPPPKDVDLPIILLNVNGEMEVDYDVGRYVDICKKYHRVLRHEVIHYINWFSYKNHEFLPSGQPKPRNYSSDFSNPEEFNAYFHQVASMVTEIADDSISKGYVFENVFGDNTQEFIAFCWKIIDNINSDLYQDTKKDNVYKLKWLKRLYQLYFDVREYYYKEAKRIKK